MIANTKNNTNKIFVCLKRSERSVKKLDWECDKVVLKNQKKVYMIQKIYIILAYDTENWSFPIRMDWLKNNYKEEAK